MRKTRTPPWKKKNPRRGKRAPHKLSPEQKARAKARAKRAGRHYPNLVDNMWASTHPRTKKRSHAD